MIFFLQDISAPLVLELTIITNLQPIRNEYLWKKIAQIGNYCQLKAACCYTF
jgi:hypothetical protein